MLKLKSFDHQGNEVEKVVLESQIIGISERKVAPTKLYDDQGNLVKETPNESVYDIHLENGSRVTTDKATYDKLCKKLNVEAL